jgi:arginine utilization protein RocB
MDSPDQCLADVDDYYQQNQATVDKIREQTEKAMAKVMPMMEKYQNKYAQMSEAELEALERQAKQQEARHGGGRMAPGMARYTKAMEKFTMKYPQQGMVITTKLMQFVPGFYQEE